MDTKWLPNKVPPWVSWYSGVTHFRGSLHLVPNSSFLLCGFESIRFASSTASTSRNPLKYPLTISREWFPPQNTGQPTALRVCCDDRGAGSSPRSCGRLPSCWSWRAPPCWGRGAARVHPWWPRSSSFFPPWGFIRLNERRMHGGTFEDIP